MDGNIFPVCILDWNQNPHKIVLQILSVGNVNLEMNRCNKYVYAHICFILTFFGEMKVARCKIWHYCLEFKFVKGKIYIYMVSVLKAVFFQNLCTF